MNLYLHFDHEVRGKPGLNCSARQESSSLRLRELDEFESFFSKVYIIRFFFYS